MTAADYSVRGPSPNGYAVLHEASGSYAADGLELEEAERIAAELNAGRELAALEDRAAETQEQMQQPGAPRCPGCGRVMSNREAIEQAACNDCSGGAYDPRDGR